ncbi:MAG: WGR domain-containing protein [Cyanobacteria bacterium J06555_13]
MQAINYQVERWQRQDWRKETRFYSCALCQNLFGEWIVLRRWGRVSALKGQSLEHHCASYEEGLEILSEVAKRRSQRGYVNF